MIRSVCILNRVATGPKPGGPVSPLEGFIPWSAENDKRSPHTTPLSKFRDNSPCVDTLYSAARAISQACCEITSVVISNPLNALMASQRAEKQREKERKEVERQQLQEARQAAALAGAGSGARACEAQLTHIERKLTVQHLLALLGPGRG